MESRKTTRHRHSKPSFPVFMRAEIGAVEMSGTATDPPEVAAFRIIMESAPARSDTEGTYEFTPPGGPTFTVGISYE